MFKKICYDKTQPTHFDTICNFQKSAFLLVEFSFVKTQQNNLFDTMQLVIRFLFVQNKNHSFFDKYEAIMQIKTARSISVQNGMQIPLVFHAKLDHPFIKDSVILCLKSNSFMQLSGGMAAGDS